MKQIPGKAERVGGSDGWEKGERETKTERKCGRGKKIMGLSC